MGTVSENQRNFMTKKQIKTVKKTRPIKQNIYSIYNQEFRFPSLLTRLKNLIVDWIL
jgi:hypothetical protein